MRHNWVGKEQERQSTARQVVQSTVLRSSHDVVRGFEKGRDVLAWVRMFQGREGWVCLLTRLTLHEPNEKAMTSAEAGSNEKEENEATR